MAYGSAAWLRGGAVGFLIGAALAVILIAALAWRRVRKFRREESVEDEGRKTMSTDV